MGEENKSSLFPTYGRFPITIVKGEGSRLWDDTGKEYLDLMTGIAVTNLGHAPKQIKEKLVEQLDQLWHISNLFGIPNQEKLAKLLTDNSCADAVFFCNSGAEANEAAIKLARRYNQKVLGNERYEIVTFKQSFHGRTLATLTATGQAKVQEGFLPLPEGFVYAPYNDADALKGYINEKTCAIMLELVQAEGGIIVADPSGSSRIFSRLPKGLRAGFRWALCSAKRICAMRSDREATAPRSAERRSRRRPGSLRWRRSSASNCLSALLSSGLSRFAS